MNERRNQGTITEPMIGFLTAVGFGLVALFALDWMLGGEIGAIRQVSPYWNAIDYHLSIGPRRRALEEPRERASCLQRGGTITEIHGPFFRSWECHGLSNERDAPL